MKNVSNLDRKKKFLILFPLFLLPFLAAGFYALGGGRATPAATPISVNTSLPDAKFGKPDSLSRLALYQKAENDSVHANSGLSGLAERLGFESSTPDKADELQQRLAVLTKEIERAQEDPTPPRRVAKAPISSSIKADVDRLQSMMQAVQQPAEKDQELDQLNQLTSSIKDILNPERMTNVRPQSAVQSPFKAFRAEIDGKQKVKAGSAVRLRLLDTLMLKGKTLLPGQLLFGSCRLANHRLLLDIESIRDGDVLLPADLTVYSLDGMVGIDAPEAELAGAVGSGTDNALRGIGIGSFDQSIATQAAAAGIEATKSLLSKKVRSIKVKLRNNYPVLLRNNAITFSK